MYSTLLTLIRTLIRIGSFPYESHITAGWEAPLSPARCPSIDFFSHPYQIKPCQRKKNSNLSRNEDIILYSRTVRSAFSYVNWCNYWTNKYTWYSEFPSSFLQTTGTITSNYIQSSTTKMSISLSLFHLELLQPDPKMVINWIDDATSDHSITSFPSRVRRRQRKLPVFIPAQRPGEIPFGDVRALCSHCTTTLRPVIASSLCSPIARFPRTQSNWIDIANCPHSN